MEAAEDVWKVEGEKREPVKPEKFHRREMFPRHACSTIAVKSFASSVVQVLTCFIVFASDVTVTASFTHNLISIGLSWGNSFAGNWAQVLNDFLRWIITAAFFVILY